MTGWIWVDEQSIIEAHEESLSLHGGPSGIRDSGLLASALARPKQLEAYGEKIDAVALAGAYTLGIVQNHPFVDGNKRTGFVAGLYFLRLNGWNITANQEQVVEAVRNLAAGAMDEEGYRAFLRAHLAPFDQEPG